MVSSPSLVTITHTEIMELCKRLGHDPARVTRITIEPDVVVVEYAHPITGVDPSFRVDEVQHMVLKGTPPAPRPDDKPWPGTGPPPVPPPDPDDPWAGTSGSGT